MGKRTGIAAALVLTALAGAASAQTLPPVAAERAAWMPKPGLRWQVQYTGMPLNLGVEADAYILDLFDTDPRSIEALKKRGKRSICYLNAGASEDWRPDSKSFPPSVLGPANSQWPGERLLDIRQVDVLLPLMTARLQLCRARGFDGVMLSNIGTYDKASGLDLTPYDQLRYNARLANEARKRGLAVGMENDAAQAEQLQPYFDWALAESCVSQGWCQRLSTFTANEKAVVAIEYTNNRFKLQEACQQTKALKFSLIIKTPRLDAFREECPKA